MLPRITIFLAVLVFGSIAPTCRAAALFPISHAAITQSINLALNARSALINITEDDIRLPVLPRARTANPVLILATLKSTMDRNTFWASLRCHPSTDCMSFVVLLRPPIFERDSIRQELAKNLENKAKPRLIPAGTRMHFVCQKGNVLISMQVRTLRSARLGDEVRVYDDQSRKIYLGRLAAPGLVEASY